MIRRVALLLAAILVLPTVQAADGVELAVATPGPYTHAAAAGESTSYTLAYHLDLDRAMTVRLCSVARLQSGSLLAASVSWQVDGTARGTSTNSLCLGDDASLPLAAGRHELSTVWAFTMPASASDVGLRALVRELPANTGSGSGAGGTTSSSSREIVAQLQPLDRAGPGISAIGFDQAGHDVTARWSTSEDATSSIRVVRQDEVRNVMGQGGPRHFTALLADMAPGNYQYTITAADAAGNSATASGTLAVQGDDSDGDGVPDSVDNCRTMANAGQQDFDGDGLGDVCDADDDGDGAPDSSDAFPKDPRRASGADLDGDGYDDEYDPDDDGDGDLDTSDNCPRLSNPPQADLDQDGQGDACDADDDGDNVADEQDAFPRDPARSQTPPPSPDQPTGDPDGDGVPSDQDNCPTVANGDQQDRDEDGLGDACDVDDDGDRVPDERDAFPLDPRRASGADLDGDRIDDEFDSDDDGDGRVDAQDNCPRLANAAQEDLDGDVLGDACDDDDDGDGAPDPQDAFPRDPGRNQVDARDNIPVEQVQARSFVASPKMVRDLEALGVAVPQGSLLFLDQDKDGLNDTVRDTSGILALRHPAIPQQLFLMEDAAGRLVLLMPRQDRAEGVLAMPGEVVSVKEDLRHESGQAPGQPLLMTLRVAQKSGWIVVSAPDVAPTSPVSSVWRGSQALPIEMVWRDGGQVHILDDPVTQYTIGYNQGAVKEDGFPWVWVGVGAACVLLAIVAIALIARRR